MRFMAPMKALHCARYKPLEELAVDAPAGVRPVIVAFKELQKIVFYDLGRRQSSAANRSLVGVFLPTYNPY